MQTGRRRAAVLLVSLALVAAACGDDDDEPEAASTSSEAEAAGGASELTISMVDYGYEIEGALAPGVQTFSTTNDGDELHMMGIGKLKAGVTLAEVQKELAKEDADFEALFEEELGAPGHVLLPGVSQTITLEEGLEEGEYAMLCFIPTEEEGPPHFAKGMVATFEVAADGEGDAELPEPDASYALRDREVPDGPDELDAGEVTFEISNEGGAGKDFIVVELDEGEDFDSFDRFFTEVYEGDEPPPKNAVSKAPGTIAFSTFEIEAGQTLFVTMELTPGTWQIVNTTNADEGGEEGEEEEEDPDKDKILEVTVR